MLHSYSFSNFLSFANLTTVNLTVSAKQLTNDWMVDTKGIKVNKVTSVFGPNGGGKTSLVKPIVFMNWFISHSFQLPIDSNISYKQHANYLDTPSTFSFEREFQGDLWRYSLECMPNRVLSEKLERKKLRFTPVFERTWNNQTKSYNIKTHKDFHLDKTITENLRQTVSLISWAAQYGIPLAKQLIEAWDTWSNISQSARLGVTPSNLIDVAELIEGKTELTNKMNEIVCSWDLGISGIGVHEFEISDEKDPANKRNILVPFAEHHGRNKSFQLPLSAESEGTQSGFILLGMILPILERGGLAVIDELESNLHPHMLMAILDLFASPVSNKNNAQLLFTCHALEMLNVLHKSQIVFVEKDTFCESHSWRLDDIEGVRLNDNYYAKYMAGAYGAIPNL